MEAVPRASRHFVDKFLAKRFAGPYTSRPRDGVAVINVVLHVLEKSVVYSVDDGNASRRNVAIDASIKTWPLRMLYHTLGGHLVGPDSRDESKWHLERLLDGLDSFDVLYRCRRAPLAV